MALMQGCQEPGAAKALYQLLVQRGVGSPLDAPSKCYPIRFQACFTGSYMGAQMSCGAVIGAF